MNAPTDSPLALGGLRLFVADRIGPFFRRILEARPEIVVALHVIGSAVTDDFEPERSDINSMIVLQDMDLEFLDLLSRLCRESSENRIRPPLLLTPGYIERWQDVSPIELLDLKLVNVMVYGVDLLSQVEIRREPVRLQCKRELRNRLVMLSWGYVGAAGNRRDLTDLLQTSVFGLVPLVRGILFARGETPPPTAKELFDALAAFVGPAALSFKEVYWMKLRRMRMPVARVRATLRDYYRAIETLIDVVDQIQIPGE